MINSFLICSFSYPILCTGKYAPPEWQTTFKRKMVLLGISKLATFGDEHVIDDFKENIPELRTCTGVILIFVIMAGGNSEIGAEILKIIFTDAKAC